LFGQTPEKEEIEGRPRRARENDAQRRQNCLSHVFFPPPWNRIERESEGEIRRPAKEAEERILRILRQYSVSNYRIAGNCGKT